jgi:hypothetical protein
VYTGHFAECQGHSTRQKKEHLGTDKASFAECYGPGTRQRSKLCRVPPRTLDKETDKGARW